MSDSNSRSFTGSDGQTYFLNKDRTIVGRKSAEAANHVQHLDTGKVDLSKFAVSSDPTTLSQQLGYANTPSAITPTKVDSPKFDQPLAEPKINLTNGNTYGVGVIGDKNVNIKVIPLQTASFGKLNDPNLLKVVGNLGSFNIETAISAPNGTVKNGQNLPVTVGFQSNNTTSLKASFTQGKLTQVEGETKVGDASVNLGVKGFNKNMQTAFVGVQGKFNENLSLGAGLTVDLNTPKVNPTATVAMKFSF
jgi:hypothetical protein